MQSHRRDLTQYIRDATHAETLLSVRSATKNDADVVSEMAGTVGAHFSELISTNGAAEASILLLAVCAVVFGIGRAYSDRMPRWWSAAVQAAGLLLGIAVFAVQLRHGGWLVDVDHAVTDWLVHHRNPILDVVAVAVSNLFSPIVIAAGSLLTAVVAALRFKSYLCGIIVIGTVACASTLCTVIKVGIARHRPPAEIQETLETDYAFPSGHVTGVTALFAMIVLVVGISRSQSVKRLLAGVAAVVVAAVALSRLYLAVHWLTDVLAGALLASAVVAFGATALHGAIRHTDAQTPKTALNNAPWRVVL